LLLWQINAVNGIYIASWPMKTLWWLTYDPSLL